MRSRQAMLGAAVLVVVLAGGWWLFSRTPGGETPADGDDFDYAAAFESLDPGSTAPLFRIVEVAGKTEAEVAAALGPPWNCESTLYSRRCSYAPGSTEVVYIDGRADWLTVNALGEAPLDDAILMRIGLKAAKPSSANDEERVWTDLAGLRELRAVGSAQRVEFLRIKVKS